MKFNNIMVVEDDNFQSKILCQQINKAVDTNIITAKNGAEAIKAFEEDIKIDVVFCDLNMPTIDGVEFIRALKTKQEKPTLVLVSSQKEDILSAVKLMAEHYGFFNVKSIAKPTSVENVASTLLQEDLKPSGNNKCNSVHVITKQNLLSALSRDEFVMHFQPHISTDNGNIVGVESLIRWQHPEHGLLFPNDFLSEINKYNLTYELSKYVCRKSIETCVNLHKLGMKIAVSVNLTPTDLCHHEFVDYIEELMKKHKLAHKFLTIEVTESYLTKNIAGMLDTMTRLRMRGFRMSIDDYGTGHSSLMQLINAPFNELKIDLSFVRHMHHDKKSYAAVKTSISLARSIGISTVAEGVETEWQAKILSDLGCDILQGYLYSKPISESSLISYLKSNMH